MSLMATSGRTPRGIVLVATCFIVSLIDTSCLRGQAEVEAPANVESRVAVTDRTLEQWIVGGATSSGTIRTRFEFQLNERLRDLVETYPLSDALQQKLKLAGRGDIRRFFDEFDSHLQTLGKSSSDGMVPESKVIEVQREIQPLRIQYMNGVFGESSLFHKTLWANLDTKQRRQLAEQTQHERQKRFEAQFDSFLANWRTLSLRDEQKQTLKKFFSREIPPPPYSNSLSYHYLTYRLAKLPEEKVRPLFDEEQWVSLSQLLAQAGRYEQLLTANGLLRDMKTTGNTEEPE